MDEKIVELEKQVAALRRNLNQVTVALDETRRRVNLSPIYDEQVLTINSRAKERAP